MSIRWSDFALQSLEEIVMYYDEKGGAALAERVQLAIYKQIERASAFPESHQESDIFPLVRRVVIRTFPYVAFIRASPPDSWEVIDVVHTSRKLPKEGHGR